MQYEEREIGEISVIRIRESRLTSQEAPEMKTAFLKMLTEGRRILIINLADVEYMDSTGLGSFLFGIRQAEANDKELIFCGLSPRIESLIKIAQLDSILEIYETEEIAIKEVQDDLNKEIS
ncbi:STAS domain-containing protein [bacterium]|nr:STAS domain-containing protein [bacterium]